ncbi:MAG: tRNA (guanosine(46)-N7)-methyltransferase TrmB [Cyanobacteria bacterium P01_D01_bin.123]
MSDCFSSLSASPSDRQARDLLYDAIPAPVGLKQQRVRNHVNPFHLQYQTPAPTPHWEQTYARLQQRFHLDIGSGTGRFALALAERHPEWNVLGIEIRQPLVERANAWVQKLQLDNVHFVSAHATVTLPHLFAPGELARVSIQFPDPWFKKRHHKRRVVQPELVALLARLMQPGAALFLQSDIEDVAVEMEARFVECSAFHNPSGPHAAIASNPLGVATHRELSCATQNLPVYRYWLERREDC